jgi:hypothetical protein
MHNKYIHTYTHHMHIYKHTHTHTHTHTYIHTYTTITYLHRMPVTIIPSYAPGLFCTCFYKHARRLRLEKLLEFIIYQAF